VLKGPLTPGHKKAEVFGHFWHRPMPHSVVVKYLRAIWVELQIEPVRQNLANAMSTREVIELVLDLNPEIQKQVITLLYLWWSERCGVREGSGVMESV